MLVLLPALALVLGLAVAGVKLGADALANVVGVAVKAALNAAN